jgi:hypothetical protein
LPELLNPVSLRIKNFKLSSSLWVIEKKQISLVGSKFSFGKFSFAYIVDFLLESNIIVKYNFHNKNQVKFGVDFD